MTFFFTCCQACLRLLGAIDLIKYYYCYSIDLYSIGGRVVFGGSIVRFDFEVDLSFIESLKSNDIFLEGFIVCRFFAFPVSNICSLPSHKRSALV